MEIELTFSDIRVSALVTTPRKLTSEFVFFEKVTVLSFEEAKDATPTEFYRSWIRNPMVYSGMSSNLVHSAMKNIHWLESGLTHK